MDKPIRLSPQDIIHIQANNFNTNPLTDENTQNYLKELANSTMVKQLQNGELPLDWTTTTLISDNPIKGLGQASPENTVLAHIAPLMAEAQQELLVVSPYFVPTQVGTNHFKQIAQTGKQVTILTNALSATDVAPVHAGYAKYRKELLNAGIKLFELKPNATIHTNHHGGLFNSSGASLHAKTFSIDNKRVFVGSFNMDPRSAQLNTEMGLLIDSPFLANQLTQGFKTHQANTTYTVNLTNENLSWQTQENNETVIYDKEPHSGTMKQFFVWICTLLPIEWLL